MPTAYSYLRFSSPQQAAGDSVRRQTEATSAWCAKNGVVLDAKLRLRDEGVSAFKGRHRAAENADTHALAGFLQLVKDGRVEPGSYLILESLDRLTREDIVPAVNLFTSLLLAGVKVVQLHPVEHVYTSTADMTHVMLALVELSRGNSESKMKSERVGAAWRRKQKEAASKLVTVRVPNWMTVKDGKPVLIPERAAVVRRVFDLTIAGHSQMDIARTFNAEGVPVFGRSPAWTNNAVYQILTSRATVGEYIPYAHKNKARPPKGEPVPGYFPAVVDEETYRRAATGAARRGQVGRGRRGDHVNLFAGLLVEARGGGPLNYWHAGARPANLIPYWVKDGRGSAWASFPVAEFERAVLRELAEVSAADVLGTRGVRLDDLTARLAEKDALTASWKAQMDNPAIVHIVAEKLTALMAERAELAAAVERERAELASPADAAWGDFRGLVGLAEGGDDATRLKIRAALRRAIDRVFVLIVPKNKFSKVAAVQVRFVAGGPDRFYVLIYQRGKPTVVISGPLGGEGHITTPEAAARFERKAREVVLPTMKAGR